MKILLIGGGGREHALAAKLLENKVITKLYCAPGNGGTRMLERCENVQLGTVDDFVKFAEDYQIDLTIAGGEEFLVQGIYDRFAEKGLRLFGPSRKGAMLEGSKAYSKEFMQRYGIRTAASETFHTSGEALDYLEKTHTYPIVVKADGLALGKGVLICENREEARKAVHRIMEERAFADAGKTVVIEQFLEGKEASILSFCDGKTILPLLSAKDHKRAYDGDKGENTGGMGVVSPNPYVTPEILESFEKDISAPTLRGIQEEGLNFVGIIFFGLMLCEDGVYLLEYNVRMGDPETQAVLPLMETDLLDLVISALDQSLDSFRLEWKPHHSVCVTVASGGYPGAYTKGLPIEGIEDVDGLCYVAGADYNSTGELVTTGGRVLNVVCTGDTQEDAFAKVYKEVGKIRFKGAFWRTDIGK